MKKTALFLIFLSSLFHGFAQTPGVKWIKYASSYNDGETFYDLKPTSDRGFIAVGSDSVFGFNRNDLLRKREGTQPWIVKFDSAGNTVWNRTSFGYNSGLTSVVQSSDGGFVAAGFDQEPIPPFDTSRFHIVKYDASGNQVWQKLYGGTNADVAYSIARTSAGGYVVAGFTKSNNGDVTGNHSPGSADVWLMKLDATGNFIWKKCFGGTGLDTAFAVIQTPDKGFVVAGSSTSSNGDLTGNNGLTDAWLFKTDSLGNLVWQNNYGGANVDVFKHLVVNSDGSFTVTGYTFSATATSNGNKGKADVWVARIANGGAVIWSKGFGGAQDESGFSIVSTQENSFLVTGFTESNNADVSNNNGLADGWFIKISGDGNLIWQRCVGTIENEYAFAGAYLTESDFAIGGLADPPSPPGDPMNGFIARLGNSSHLRAVLNSPYSINTGLLVATKPGVQYAALPLNGIAKTDIDTGTYNVSFTFPHPYFTVTPPSHTVNFPVFFDTVTVTFNVLPIPGQRDLAISSLPMNVARPGFNLTYKIFYKNAGTDTVASGQVHFKRDTRLNFISASPAISSMNGDTLKWNYTNFKPFDTASITVNMLVQSPPVVNIGDTLTSIALITPLAGDVTPSDDTAIIRQRVVGSYDPNDKTENLSGRISLQQVTAGTYINYLIRFQNTGTDTAFNVVIRDTLDAKLDWNSLQMIGASHAYNLQIASQNRMAWHFNNIRLVDSVRNEPASHGFVAFRIKPKNNLILGDIIKNSASIYFDYNLPVRTNIQETIVMNNIITGIGGPQADVFSMSLFPNPAGEIIWLRLKDRVQGEAVLSVIDMNGHEVYRKTLGNVNSSNYTTSFDLSRYPSGMYTILLSIGKNLYSQKLILQ